jgi:hypothetical protein
VPGRAPTQDGRFPEGQGWGFGGSVDIAVIDSVLEHASSGGWWAT